MQEPNASRPTIPASWIVAGIACAVAGNLMVAAVVFGAEELVR